MGGGGWSNLDPTSSKFMGGMGSSLSPGGRMPGAGKLSGGGKGPKPPTAPDFDAAAREQARTSRNDVTGAFGGGSWSQTPDGRWSLDVNMSPELQAQAQRLMGGLGNQLDPAATREAATDAAYRSRTSRLDPRFAQERGSLESRLAAEGFSRGDAGWSTALDEFGRGQNDAYSQALLESESGAGNTAFGQSLAANMQPYQQLGAIQSMGEGLGRQALGQADPVQALAAAMSRYSGDLQGYGAQQAGKNSKMQGGASLLPLLAAA
jgi:hypothetical protein